LKKDLTYAVFLPKYFIHHGSDTMHIFIPDLHEDGAGVSEKIAGNRETVTQIGEIAMDTVAPGVAEGFDLFRLSGDVAGVAILYVAAGC
jgi:hypothetical protein